MKLEFWWIGKTNEKYITEGIEIYSKRLKHYNPSSIEVFKDVKSSKNSEELRVREGEKFLSSLQNNDFLVLLDEKGKLSSSSKFASQLENWIGNSQYRKIVFIIAGAYGASETLKTRANYIWSMSDLTFSHQMIRLFLMEQIYRCFTILRNEKYHNQ